MASKNGRVEESTWQHIENPEESGNQNGKFECGEQEAGREKCQSELVDDSGDQAIPDAVKPNRRHRSQMQPGENQGVRRVLPASQ